MLDYIFVGGMADGSRTQNGWLDRPQVLYVRRGSLPLDNPLSYGFIASKKKEEGSTCYILLGVCCGEAVYVDAATHLSDIFAVAAGEEWR